MQAVCGQYPASAPVPPDSCTGLVNATTANTCTFSSPYNTIQLSGKPTHPEAAFTCQQSWALFALDPDIKHKCRGDKHWQMHPSLALATCAGLWLIRLPSHQGSVDGQSQGFSPPHSKSNVITSTLSQHSLNMVSAQARWWVGPTTSSLTTH